MAAAQPGLQLALTPLDVRGGVVQAADLAVALLARERLSADAALQPVQMIPNGCYVVSLTRPTASFKPRRRFRRNRAAALDTGG